MPTFRNFIQSLSIAAVVVSILAASQGYAQDFGVDHQAILGAVAGKDLPVSVGIGDADAENVSYLVFYWRQPGESKFKSLVLKRSAGSGKYEGKLEGKNITPAGLEYYLRLTDKNGTNHYVFSAPQSPMIVQVSVSEEASDAAASSMDAGGMDELFGGGGKGEGLFQELEAEFALVAAEDVVVSAAKHAQKLSDSPSAIYVLTENDIRASGYTSLSDVLRLAPGMDVYRVSPAYSIVGIRGFGDEGNNLVLILIDGREVNIELFGAPFLENLPISLSEIERIEIIRGPGSALYGANAFSGVVNIISKKTDKANAGAHGSLYGGPRFSTAIADVSATGVTGSTGYRFSGRYQRGNSFAGKVLGVEQHAVRGLWHTSTPVGKLDFDGGVSQQSGEIFTAMGELPGRMTQVHSLAGWSYEDFSAKIGLQEWQGQFFTADPVLSKILPELRIKTNTVSLDAQWGHLFGDVNQLIIGTNVRANFFDAEALLEPKQQETRVGVFVQDEIYAVENLIVNIGGRSDFSTFYRAEDTSCEGSPCGMLDRITFSPRLSTVYAFNESNTGRFTVGTAFRKPAFFESRFELAGLEGLAANFADKDLANEQIYAAELGYVARPVDELRLQADGFANLYRDLIDYDPGLGRFSNGARDSFATGGEVAARIKITQWLQGHANLALLFVWNLTPNPLADNLKKGDAEYNCGSTDISANQAAQATPDEIPTCWTTSEADPQVKAGFGLWAEKSGFFGSANAEWTGHRLWYIVNPDDGSIIFPSKQFEELGEYITLSARAGYKIPDVGLEFGIVGQQLQNDGHREFPGIFGIDPPSGVGYPEATESYGGEPIKANVLAYVEGTF